MIPQPSHLSALQQLAALTTIVADTGDITAIEHFQPAEATTNPSLITAAIKTEYGRQLLHEELSSHDLNNISIDHVIEALTVQLGAKIAHIIQGRVSTEVNANLSYDTQQTIANALDIIQKYNALGISAERILIKIAATWEGIKAAEQLEKQGICCNLTLVFAEHQAQACAEAGITLISPFVGRILDWYKKMYPKESFTIERDPGVLSVKSIYQLFKAHQFKTQVMGASFRSTEQVLALAGCDLLTISPVLLSELAALHTPITAQLGDIEPASAALPALTEAQFRELHHNNPMATELLEQGINGFIAARKELERIIEEAIALQKSFA